MRTYDARGREKVMATDDNAIHVNVSGEISGIGVKASPVGGDFILIENSEAGNVKAHVLISSLPAGGEINALEADGVNGIMDDEIILGSGGGTVVYSKISALPDEPSPAALDFLLVELADGTLARADIGDLPGGSAEINALVADGIDGIANDQLAVGTGTDTAAYLTLSTAGVVSFNGTVFSQGEIAALSDVSGTTGTGATVMFNASPTIVTPTIAAAGWTNATHTHVGASTGGTIAIAATTGTLAVARGGTGVTASTGTTNVVLSGSPTIVTPNIASFTNATHDHSGGAGGGTALSGVTIAGSSTINAALTWNEFRQTFNPNATIAGINVGTHTAEPSTPIDGDVFYDSTATQIKGRVDGAWVNLGAGAGGGDPDQNLYETFAADTSSTTADTITDTLTIAGGTGLTTTATTDTVTVDLVNATNGGILVNSDSVQLDINNLLTDTPVVTDTIAFEDTGGGNDNKCTISVLSTVIDHDASFSHDPNEHVDHTGVTVTVAGDTNEITVAEGAQDIAANLTFTVGIADNPVMPGTFMIVPLKVNPDPTGTDGRVYYNTTTDQLKYATNTTWQVVANLDEAQTFTNKTHTAPIIGAAEWTNANHTHAGATTGGVLQVTNLNGTTWNVLYTDGSSNVIELALGTAGQHLESGGPAAAPTWEDVAGGGNVSNSGTPSTLEYARWVTATSIEGRAVGDVLTDISATPTARTLDINGDANEIVVDLAGPLDLTSNRAWSIGIANDPTIPGDFMTVPLKADPDPTGSNGRLFYNTTDNVLRYAEATTWRDIVYVGGAFHDGFSDVDSNQHIDHTGVTVSAGAGMTGGGTIEANLTLNVIGATNGGLLVNAADIQLDINSLATDTPVTGDFIAFEDIGGGLDNKATFATVETILVHDNLSGGTAAVAHGATGAVMGTTNTQTVTNKDMTADNNTFRGSRHITVEDPVVSEDITIFYTDVAITVTAVEGVILGSTNIPVDLMHNTDRNATGNNVFAAQRTVSSTTTGDNLTLGGDITIPAASFVWLETGTPSGTPNELHLTIFWDQD